MICVLFFGIYFGGGSSSLSLLDPPYIMANPLAIINFPFTLQNVEEFGIEKFEGV